MNKVMLIVLLLVCSFGCIMWSVDAMAKSSTNKQVSTKIKSVAKTKVNLKDGAEMILIPAGEFLMGTSEEQIAALLKANPDFKREWFTSEKPQHKVYLDAFYMYKTEVTVAQYRKFCKATNRNMPKEPGWKWQDNHPIVNVSWNAAKVYADWAGVVLPTEAQWEKAARGTDGRIYPWGNEWDITKCANWGNSKNGTKPVGSFQIGDSPYGIMDMAGNVWEWCADWYGADYYKNTQVKNPIGPETGIYRVLRGGAWYNNINNNRSAYRDYINPGGVNSVGFRCVSPGP